MEEVDTLALYGQLALIVFLCLRLPQILGCWTFHRSTARSLPIRTLTLLVAPAIYFVIAASLWNLRIDAIHAAGRRACGAMGAAASGSIIYGTIFHFALGLAVVGVFTLVTKKSGRMARPQIGNGRT